MKKFIIIVVCLVAITICLGLPNRMNVEGIETALSYPDANINEVKDDIELLSVAAFVVERFPSSENGFFQMNILYGSDGNYRGLQVSYLNDVGVGVVNLFEPDEVSLEVAKKAVNIFKPLSFDWFDSDGTFLNAVDTIAHFFCLLYVGIEILLLIVFDTFFAALGLVRGALYLLGF